MERSEPSKIVGGAVSRQTGSRRMSLLTLAVLVGINLLWAGSSLAAKVALHAIPPMTLAFTRFSVAALLMYGIAL